MWNEVFVNQHDNLSFGWCEGRITCGNCSKCQYELFREVGYFSWFLAQERDPNIINVSRSLFLESVHVIGSTLITAQRGWTQSGIAGMRLCNDFGYPALIGTLWVHLDDSLISLSWLNECPYEGLFYIFKDPFLLGIGSITLHKIQLRPFCNKLVLTATRRDVVHWYIFMWFF